MRWQFAHPPCGKQSRARTTLPPPRASAKRKVQRLTLTKPATQRAHCHERPVPLCLQAEADIATAADPRGGRVAVSCGQADDDRGREAHKGEMAVGLLHAAGGGSGGRRKPMQPPPPVSGRPRPPFPACARSSCPAAFSPPEREHASHVGTHGRPHPLTTGPGQLPARSLLPSRTRRARRPDRPMRTRCAPSDRHRPPAPPAHHPHPNTPTCPTDGPHRPKPVAGGICLPLEPPPTAPGAQEQWTTSSRRVTSP